MNSPWLHRAQTLFVILALLLVAYALRSQWDELRTFEWQLQPGWLLLSAGLMITTFLVEVGIWRALLRMFGETIPFLPAIRIWFLSMVVRYIPGNIWQPLSMTLYCQQWGVRPETSVISVVLYQVITLLSAAPIAVFYFGWSGNWGMLSSFLSSWAPMILPLLLAPVLAFVVRPAWMIALINWGLGKLGRPTLAIQLTSTRMLILLLLGVSNWLLWGATFATLAFALGTSGLGKFAAIAPHLVLSYPVAYAIGFLSLITPSGLGVREGALFLLLSPLLGGGVATLIALAMRIWSTLGEVVLAGSVALWGMLAPQIVSPTVPRPATTPLSQSPVEQ